MTAAEAVEAFRLALHRRPDATNERDQLYSFVRSRKFVGVDESATTLFPTYGRRFLDHKFNVEVLLHANPESLQTFFRDLAGLAPVDAQYLLQFAIHNLTKADNYNLAVKVLAYTLYELGLDPAQASKLDNPWLEKSMLEMNSVSLAHALRAFYTENAVLASRLASAFLRILTKHKRLELCARLEQLQLAEKHFTADDLHWCMFYRCYKGDAAGALELYDAHPDLHQESHKQAVLVAAAQVNDFSRLQKMFEQIELSHRTSGQYETVLKAVSRLGGTELLESIQMAANLGANLTGGASLVVYHALIYSYGKLGKIGHVKHIFEELCAHNEPTRLSFTLVLAGIKDSTELQYCFELVGRMVGEYHIPLSNHELSQMLSMCRPRKDTEMAESIFAWARTLFEPDLASWNAYLNALVEVPHKAWDEAQKMLHTPDLVTFTTLLSHCSRYGNADVGAKVLAAKEQLNIPSDENWLACLLAYQVRLNQVRNAEETFEDLLKASSKSKSAPLADYYGVLLGLYTHHKQGAKARRLVDNMFKQQIEPGMGFYTKYLRYLVDLEKQPGLNSAYQIAKDLLVKGHYDPNARSVPRDKLPVSAVKSVVRALIKANDYGRAQDLLHLLKDHGQKSTVAGLWMELASSRNDPEGVLKWWQTLCESLQPLFVAASDKEYKMPRSLRNVYALPIECLIETLFMIHQYERALRLPEELAQLGLDFTSRHWNMLVKNLVACPKEELLAEAFKIAEEKLARNWLASQHNEVYTPLLDGRTIRMLYSAVPRLVDLHSAWDKVTRDQSWRSLPKKYRYTLAVFAKNKK